MLYPALRVDCVHNWESLPMSFIVQRPGHEPVFMLIRHEA
jgi:hypothetical protein